MFTILNVPLDFPFSFSLCGWHPFFKSLDIKYGYSGNRILRIDLLLYLLLLMFQVFVDAFDVLVGDFLDGFHGAVGVIL